MVIRLWLCGSEGPRAWSYDVVLRPPSFHGVLDWDMHGMALLMAFGTRDPVSCSGVDDGSIVFCSVLRDGQFCCYGSEPSPYENFLHTPPTCMTADCVHAMKIQVLENKMQAPDHSCRLATHQDLVSKISYS